MKLKLIDNRMNAVSVKNYARARPGTWIMNGGRDLRLKVTK